jgi:hypothetical protein
VARGRRPRTPVRPHAQRAEALQRANEIRIARAALKRQLALGTLEITGLLAAPPACTRTQKVDELLLALPKYGPVRVSRLLSNCGIRDAFFVSDHRFWLYKRL